MTPRPRHLPWTAALVAFALALPGAWLAPRVFFASWLTAWWFVWGLVVGGMVNLWMHRLTGGRWGDALRVVALPATRTLPWLLIAFLPLSAGFSRLYTWWPGADAHWTDGMAQPAFVIAWMQPAFFVARLVAYGAVWWWLARPSSLVTKGRAAASLALHAIVATLASTDLLMSLVPGWFSTAFGLVVMSGQALGGTALGVLVLGGRRHETNAEPWREPPPLWRDLGNLLLMWSMTWAYLAFMEFLVIWAEDLPHEIAWFVPRLQTGWMFCGLALAVLQLGLPLLALLQRRLKDRPQRLRWIAALLLCTQLLNTAWLVVPSVDAHSLHAAWLVPLLVLAVGLPLFGRMSGLASEQADAASDGEASGTSPKEAQGA